MHTIGNSLRIRQGHVWDFDEGLGFPFPTPRLSFYSLSECSDTRETQASAVRTERKSTALGNRFRAGGKMNVEQGYIVNKCLLVGGDLFQTFSRNNRESFPVLTGPFSTFQKLFFSQYTNRDASLPWEELFSPPLYFCLCLRWPALPVPADRTSRRAGSAWTRARRPRASPRAA